MTKDELIRKLADLTTHEQIVAFADTLCEDNAAQVAAALRLVIEWANEHNVGSGAVAVFAESLIPDPSALDRRKL